MRQFLLGLFFLFSTALFSQNKINFATSTDTEHYNWTLNLIGSIHHYHKENLGGIAIFDLGLLPEERRELDQLANVTVYDIEKTNPFILEKIKVNSEGKIARGLYSWKPVAIKEALSLFPTVFYLDSGITLTGPFDQLFQEVEKKGYFLIDCGHSIKRMATRTQIEHFSLSAKEIKTLLKQPGISAGVQGLSRKLYESYVLPLYKLAFSIKNFEDDGSCPKGFGWARHDQPLFSMQARLLGLTVYKALRKDRLTLADGSKVLLSDFFKISRQEFNLNDTRPYLRYKKEAQVL